ncbi:MAG: hypothetical protein IT184_14435 [Acidobacteria bacterium]|nr:hypothetical protein [Acidobacteriota bacterium]
MLLRGIRVIAIMSLAPLSGACHGGPSQNPLVPSPAPRELAGRWEGEVVDDVHGRGLVTVNVTALPISVSGTWKIDFTDAGLQQAGSMNGSGLGSTVSWLLTPQTPLACDYATLSGTLNVTAVVEGDRLKGSYFRFTCDASERGTVDLRKTG